MGEMKRAIAREQAAWSQSMQDEKRMRSTLDIAAAIIAAVRLARDLRQFVAHRGEPSMALFVFSAKASFSVPSSA